ncbi:glycosyltransferase family 4 protein [Pedobacter sp. N36a]|uniref:glycosyltransferase family 4 protein n=1 Tax=Pedobacter sp. N36a TaxID=2767996 RepID=UPI001656D5E7|nr:glycosyltransferase family 4 protein [Pedobacter sp. N36a]MBC8986174.1 glycosyltransferase family 4 protein [Pedobacter sp. N36a]
MKILYVLDKPNLYGSERHVLGLIQGLKNDYDISLLAFSSGPLLKILSEQNIPYNVIDLKWYPTSGLLTLFKFLKSNNYDLIHAHQPKAAFWMSIIGKILGIMSIITIHSLPSSNIQSYKNFFTKIFVGTFHYSVKYISEFFATKIIFLSHYGLTSSNFKSKSIVIPNWVETVIAESTIENSFCDPVRLISIGSVTYNKGMDRLIEALGFIRHKNWNIKIVGDCKEDFKKVLVDRAVYLGIIDRIEFVGYVENTSNLLLNSDGFVLLSRGETFGLVYIEAMNCGLPVVAWDIPVAEEIIPASNLILKKNSDLNLIFDVFYKSPQQYQSISKENRAFVKNNFSWENVSLKYRQLYD